MTKKVDTRTNIPVLSGKPIQVIGLWIGPSDSSIPINLKTESCAKNVAYHESVYDVLNYYYLLQY